MKLANKITALGAAALIGLQLFACGEEEGFDYSEGLDKNGFFEGVKASDIVTLPQYKGIDIDKTILEAADEDVQAQIDSVMASYSEYEQLTTGTVKDGDTINIDYVGSIDGVEFEGGSTGGAGTTVTIGVTSYIDDFLEQLIGHKPGENFDIEVTFPEDYGQEELNGKDAIFNVTINYIQGELLEAELTDAIASDYGFESVDAMITDIEEWLVASQKFNFFSELIAGATCESVPQSVLDYVINYDVSQYEYYAEMYGVTLDEFFVSYMGYESKQAYIDENTEVYTENAVMYLAAQAIAELEGITVSKDDLEAAGVLDYKDEYGEPYLKQYVLFQELLPDFIIENGNVK